MSQMYVKTRHGHCPRQKGWNSTLRFSWTHAQHRFLFDLLSIVNQSTSTYFRLIQHPDNSTSTYSSACFVLFHQRPPGQVANVDLIRLMIDLYRLIPRSQNSNLSIAGEDGSQMHVKTRHGHCPRQKGWNSTLRSPLLRQDMLRQDMATAHDRKVGIRLCACLVLTPSMVLSWTYSTYRISRHRLYVDLLNTLTTRRRLIRQLASSCSTRGRQAKSEMST